MGAVVLGHELSHAFFDEISQSIFNGMTREDLTRLYGSEMADHLEEIFLANPTTAYMMRALGNKAFEAHLLRLEIMEAAFPFPALVADKQSTQFVAQLTALETLTSQTRHKVILASEAAQGPLGLVAPQFKAVTDTGRLPAVINVALQDTEGEHILIVLNELEPQAKKDEIKDILDRSLRTRAHLRYTRLYSRAEVLSDKQAKRMVTGEALLVEAVATIGRQEARLTAEGKSLDELITGNNFLRAIHEAINEKLVEMAA